MTAPPGRPASAMSSSLLLLPLLLLLAATTTRVLGDVEQAPAPEHWLSFNPAEVSREAMLAAWQFGASATLESDRVSLTPDEQSR